MTTLLHVGEVAILAALLLLGLVILACGLSDCLTRANDTIDEGIRQMEAARDVTGRVDPTGNVTERTARHG